MRAKIEALADRMEAEAQSQGCAGGALRNFVCELRALIAEPEPELVWMEVQVQPLADARWFTLRAVGPCAWSFNCSGNYGFATAPTPAHAPWHGESGGKIGWWWRKA